MNLLKKRNWWIYLLLTIITLGLYNLVLANHLDVYEEEAWYQDWRYWFFGGLCFVFPIIIMSLIFVIQITCQVASRLNVPGSDIYNIPYSWILCIIVPIIGWSLIIVMLLYILLWIVVMLAKGEGEHYINT